MGQPASLKPADREWITRAACGGNTHLFFPPSAERPQARSRREAKARKLCQECPVNEQCREFGRTHREYGVWGGENEEERVRAGYPLQAPIGLRGNRHRAAS